MKAKTIQLHLRKKFKEFYETIEDEAVQKLVRDNSMITGGSIASMLMGEKPNDYDVYFTDWNTANEVAKYYVKQFEDNPPPKTKNTAPVEIKILTHKNGHEMKENYRSLMLLPDEYVRIMVKSAGIASETSHQADYEYFESTFDGEATDYAATVMDAPEDEEGKKPYRPIFLSENAVTLSQGVQLVLRFFGQPGEIHENYDFVHCTNYWTSKDGKLHLNQPALEAILAMELIYVGSKYPLASVVRIRKFVGRGWRITAGQILKISFQLSNLDLTDMAVLRDQLTGVDTAYFTELIHKMEKDDKKTIDQTYLATIIDRMF